METDMDVERQELSNLFRASTAKIGSQLDLALETGRVDVSLERSVREERFAHVRLVGGWNWGAVVGAGTGGAGVRGRMGFKYDPRALREAVFGGVAAGMKRRKVEDGGHYGKDGEKDKREDVVLLADDATSERVVFVYRGLRPLQVPPTNNTDKHATPAIGSKRPREEEQDDEYGAVYDVFRERRVGHRRGQATSPLPPSDGLPTSATTTTTTAATANTTVYESTSKGVRFAHGSKLADGGSKPQRYRRLGTGNASASGSGNGNGGDGKVVWRRTLVMRNACESDLEFGKDGVCLWVPPAAKATSTTTSTSATATATSTTKSTTTAAAAAAAAAPPPGGGGKEEKETEPRLARLEVEYDGTTRTARTMDERRGVIFPCKVWRWRPPLRVIRTTTTRRRSLKVEGEGKGKGEGEGEQSKLRVEA